MSIRPLQPTSRTDVVPTFNSVRTELLIQHSRLSGMTLARREPDDVMYSSAVPELSRFSES